jgi:hypothetical protein
MTQVEKDNYKLAANRKTMRLAIVALLTWIVALAMFAAICRGAEKPALKLKRAADGTVTLAPDLPAGTPYEWAEFGSGGTQTWGICTWIANGRPKAATYWFAYKLDGDIGPDPKPEPDPKPTPDPKPQPDPLPVAQVWLLVVEETAQRTAPQAVILASPKVRTAVDGRVALLDQSWTLPDARQSYLDAAKGKALPLMFLAPGDPQTTPASKAVFTGPLPVAVEEMVLLIGRWQKGGGK